MPGAAQPPAIPPKFTPPPGEETTAVKALIDRAKEALAAGKAPGTVLSDAQFLPAHEWPRFRQLIRHHAGPAPLTIVTSKEPGTPIAVRGTVRGPNGQSLPKVLLYVYHTSSKGWYSDRASHVSGNAGDHKHARLFGYLRTDDDGRYEFRTIRPAGYPQSDLPAHIHVEVTDGKGRVLVTEIRFDDDPRLTAAMRKRSREEGFVICPVARGADGVQQVRADLQLQSGG
jgi:protocatechuate 3,4-dioxygenase beta subunit